MLIQIVEELKKKEKRLKSTLEKQQTGTLAKNKESLPKRIYDFRNRLMISIRKSQE